ncbi:MAG: DNA polymerase III subunit delta [Bacteroidetes bacterium]|nr:MAG: DNA polymerase III subunit delta [Bacteroidota bacterium]PIE88020.1 MAG: DNA polymerase III subunit delta [Bacteroidota bacterium]
MTFEKIIANLEKRVYHPIYFLTGEQTYYIDEIVGMIEDTVLQEAERDFNQTVLYGRDTDVKQIISLAKRFPLMASHQLIIIKEAQDIKQIAGLEPYVKSPLLSTILVMTYKYKKLDRRTSFAKAIARNGVFFEAPQMRDYQMPQWISEYIRKRGFKIGPRECALLADHLGNQLGKVVNELNKLFINVPEKGTITATHIEEHIGISKEYNVFEYQNALGQRDKMKAGRIAHYFSVNEKEMPVPKITAILFNYFTKVGLYHELKNKSKDVVARALKVNPFFVKDYEMAARHYSRKSVARVIALLREYDLKSKGIGNVSNPGGELIRELNYRILAQP